MWLYAPLLQRVVLEHLKNRHDRFGLVSQDSQRLLAASAEDTIDTGEAESIDNILREAEGHLLGYRQQLGLCDIRS